MPNRSGMVQITGFPYDVSTSHTCYRMVRFRNKWLCNIHYGLVDTRTVVRRRRLKLFVHVAWFNSEVPAALILVLCCAAIQSGHPPGPDWKRPRDHPHTTWLHQNLHWHWSFHYWSKDFGSWWIWAENSGYGFTTFCCVGVVRSENKTSFL